jgi:hypothetical protein
MPAMLIRRGNKVLRKDTDNPQSEWIEVGEVINGEILWYELIIKSVVD